MLECVVYFVTVCLLELTLIYGFKRLTQHTRKVHKKYYLLIILFSGILTIEYYYKMSTLNSLTSMLCYLVLYYLLYRRSVKETVFYGTAIWIIGIIIDIIAMFGSRLFQSYPLYMVRGVYTIIMEITFILIFHMKWLQKGIKKIYDKMNRSKFPYQELILIIVVLFSLGYTLYYLMIEKNIEETATSFCFLIVSVIILIFVYINREYNLYALKETNDFLIKDNEFYLNLLNDYRSLKHNIIHQLSGVKSVANKRASKLIEALIEEYNENTKNVQNIETMPVGINGIVYEKIYSFNNKELKVEVNNKITSNVFEGLTPRSYNLLCEALGILLDNALQATEKTKEKIVMIDMQETDLVYQIKVINTFQDELDIERVGTIQYTTKETGNGIGLFSLIGRKKLRIKTTIINDLFLNEIVIEKKAH